MKLGDKVFLAYWRTAMETVDFMEYDLWLVGSLVDDTRGRCNDIDVVLTGPHRPQDIAYILNELKSCGPFDVFYQLEAPVELKWNQRPIRRLMAVPIQKMFPSLTLRGRVEDDVLLWYSWGLPSEKMRKIKKTMTPVLVVQKGVPLYL